MASSSMSDRVPESGFTPIRPNPYIVGNPVRDRSMFFGRQAEFELVRNRFQHSQHGGLLVFCGERRSGKTSILFQILDKRLGPDFIPVLIDMQSMAITGDAGFLEKVADEILRALGPDASSIEPPVFSPDANHSALFQKFIEGVLRLHPSKRLLLLFDEYELFENKIDSGMLAEDVLFALSSLMEHQSVFVIFTGSQHLEQRKRDYWRILGKSIYKTISYLEREDALNLIRKPLEGRVDYAPGTVEAIHRLTAGQPFYTQAICQNLVDGLNERMTNLATHEILATVVSAMVENPLPQMIFLWDSLERDEKLVMALLAESLPDEGSFVPPGALSRLIRQREYPLDLSNARIATALEKLFKAELLLKHDATHPPGYAFRMDLWRLWIRRMHSVWQVMREVGLEIRTHRIPRRTRVALLSGAGVVVLVAALAAWVYPGFMRGGRTVVGAGAAGAGTALFRAEVEPRQAAIFLDGKQAAVGVFVDRIAGGRDHTFRFAAAGYADTQFAVRLEPGIDQSRRIQLRPLTGGLRIETEPPGAMVAVDGVRRGPSPIQVDDLAVPEDHVVAASLPGRNPVQGSFRVRAGETIAVTLSLERVTTSVVITTAPRGAEVIVDGVSHGPSPVQQVLDLGTHTFGARREGYLARDTTLGVSHDVRDIHIALAAEPPGVLVIQGDLPAQMYVDDILVVEGVQNSGRQELQRGIHRIRVILPSGQIIDRSVSIEPASQLIYDYSSGAMRRVPLGGTRE